MATEVFRQRIPIGSVAQGTLIDDVTAYGTRFSGTAELVVLENPADGDTVTTTLNVDTILGVIGSQYGVDYVISNYVDTTQSIITSFSGKVVTLERVALNVGGNAAARHFASLLIFG